MIIYLSIITILTAIISIIITSIVYVVSVIWEIPDSDHDHDRSFSSAHQFGLNAVDSTKLVSTQSSIPRQKIDYSGHEVSKNSLVQLNQDIGSCQSFSEGIAQASKNSSSILNKSNNCSQNENQNECRREKSGSPANFTSALKMAKRDSRICCEPIDESLPLDEFDRIEMHSGGTRLHWCRKRKFLGSLVNSGLFLEAHNVNLETPLHVATRKQNFSMMIGLLCHGADVNSKNGKGETPLLMACKSNNITACQLLLTFDASVDATDQFGLSARHYASSICDKHKSDNRFSQPNAAHLILSMLNEMGAKRCRENPRKEEVEYESSSLPSCTDGCSCSGSYNGNSYDKWVDSGRESFNRKHLFMDIIESSLNTVPKSKYRIRNWIDSYGGRETKNSSKVLCLDGGGSRGVVVCQILIELQKHLKRPIIDYFDWIGGTSVGAFLACCMCKGASVYELRKLSFDIKDEVFTGAKPYNSIYLENVLKRTFGEEIRMSDLKKKKLVLTTVLGDRDPCQLRFFKTYESSSQLLDKYGFCPSQYNFISTLSIAREVRPPETVKESSNVLTVPDPSAKPTLKKINLKESNISSCNRQRSTSALPELKSSSSSLSASKSVKNKSEKEQEIKPLNEDEHDPLVWQAVRASSAAPFYFKPYGPFLDGGIISNNPTLDVMSEFYARERLKQFLKKRIKSVNLDKDCILSEEPSELDLVLSLGTGRGRIIKQQCTINFGDFASGIATVFKPGDLMRKFRAAIDLFKKLMHRSSMTDDHVVDRAQAWCSSLDIPYFRINPALTSIFSLDDKRDEQFVNALWQTKLYMKALSSQVKQLCDLLEESYR